MGERLFKFREPNFQDCQNMSIYIQSGKQLSVKCCLRKTTVI